MGNRAKMFLRTVLALTAEDLNIRPPAMPANLGRGKPKLKKAILIPDQVRTLLQAARGDMETGICVAFPFLAGTRPSEQLGLLWDDVDFDANVIRIRRMQERDGSITNLTKTVAGTRDIPMCSLLRGMLLEWRLDEHADDVGDVHGRKLSARTTRLTGIVGLETVVCFATFLLSPGRPSVLLQQIVL
jgi:integrase